LDNLCRWHGYKTNTDQSLGFPRYYIPDYQNPSSYLTYDRQFSQTRYLSPDYKWTNIAGTDKYYLSKADDTQPEILCPMAMFLKNAYLDYAEEDPAVNQYSFEEISGFGETVILNTGSDPNTQQNDIYFCSVYAVDNINLVVPYAIKQAAAEYFRLYTADRFFETSDTSGIKSFKLGEIEFEFDAADRPGFLPDSVYLIIQKYGLLYSSACVEIGRG
jgi:hypothetical protein